MTAVTSASTQQWNLQVPAGALQEWVFTFTAADGSLFPLDGHTWEYVARTSPTDTGTPVVKLTTVAGSQGVLTVDVAASAVKFTLYPAATADLAPAAFHHALWMDPGDPVSAYPWLAGALQVVGNPQP